ncbi:MAG TPA: hypoxanthine phosphoribosyltransferase [Firmicutes bacterium]|nr:hypoxanthine phosphoribosyltransferase [Bacillota bacterium]
MHKDLESILIPREEISAKVAELGRQISSDYEGQELLAICVLKGAIIFTADLLRHLTIDVTLDSISVSSYSKATHSSGVVRFLKDLDESVEGRHVLVIEDIIDTGLTLKYLAENLQSRKPKSLRICTLLDKPSRRQVDLKPDYLGFTIPDSFVVGYGLDFAQKYRHLPDVGILKPEIYGK